VIAQAGGHVRLDRLDDRQEERGLVGWYIAPRVTPASATISGVPTEL
jgi:hypothetical protein